MGIKLLQDHITRRGGLAFSTDTLNTEHLLVKAHTLIKEFELERDSASAKEVCYNLMKCFKVTPEAPDMDEDLESDVYYGRTELKDPSDIIEGTSADEYAQYIWDDVCDLFEDLAPSGFYFSSQEGDGACFGWWKEQ